MVGKEKKSIFSLQESDNIITGNENLLAHATLYYKDLFGPGGGDTFELDENLWSSEEKVTELENQALSKPFDEEEIQNPYSKWRKIRQLALMGSQLNSFRQVGIL